MSRDEHAVLRHYEVGLDEVGALLDGKAIGRQRVFGPVGAGAAMADDERRLAVKRRKAGLRISGDRQVRPDKAVVRARETTGARRVEGPYQGE
jgi:hypothetical protein